MGDEKPRVETWNRICRCNLNPPCKRRSSMKTDQINLLIGKWEGFPANFYPPTNLYFYASTTAPIISATFRIFQSFLSWKHSHQHTLKNHTTCAEHPSLVWEWDVMDDWDHRKPTFCWDYWLFAWYLPNYMGLGWLNDLWFWIDINLTNQHYLMAKIRAHLEG